MIKELVAWWRDLLEFLSSAVMMRKQVVDRPTSWAWENWCTSSSVLHEGHWRIVLHSPASLASYA